MALTANSTIQSQLLLGPMDLRLERSLDHEATVQQSLECFTPISLFVAFLGGMNDAPKISED